MCCVEQLYYYSCLSIRTGVISCFLPPSLTLSFSSSFLCSFLCSVPLIPSSTSPSLRSAGGHGSPSSPLRGRADDLVDAIQVLMDPTASTKGRAGAGEAVGEGEGGEGGGGGDGDGVSAAVRRHVMSGLYAHQFTALRWLLGIESMVRSVPADTNGSGMSRGGGGIVGSGRAGGGGPGALFRRGAAPRSPLPRSPLLCRGAVLADGMGLGKTVVALALIAIATPIVDTDDDDDNNDNEVTGHSLLSSSSSSSARHEGSGGSGGSGRSANNKRRRRSRRSNRRRRQPTLVVCPLQVLSQVNAQHTTDKQREGYT